MKILLVDDNEDSRLVLARALGGRGHKVLTARDGAEAWRLALAEKPELVISDILMPDLDGFGLCRRIKSDPALRHCLFIFYTATYLDPEDEQLGIDLGASAFVIKPVEPAVFLGIIEDTLRRYRAGELRVPAGSLAPGRELDERHDRILAKKLTEKMSELEASERRFRSIVEASPDVLFAIEPGTLVITFVSPAIRRALGIGPISVMGRVGKWIRRVHPADRRELLTTIRQGVNADWSNRELRLARDDGDYRWFSIHLALDADMVTAASAGVYGVMRDVTDRRAAEDELRKAAAVFESSLEGVVITDPDGVIRKVNKAFTDITGHAAESALGRTPRILRSGHHDRAFYQAMWAALLQDGQWRGEIWNRRSNGDIYPQWMTISAVHAPDDGRVVNYVAVFSDISMAKQSEQKINHLVHYDPLTDLPNRLLLEARLGHALQTRRGNQRRVVVLLIDIDRFKNVNDSLGHPVGDQVLRQVAARLAKRFRASDTIARVGGDEFVVVLEGLATQSVAADTATGVLAMFDDEFLVGNHEINLTASIGVAMAPDNGSNPTTLLRNADAAMYRAKDAGRNTVQFYSDELTDDARMRLSIESSMRRALRMREEFVVHYQPKVDLADGRVIGAEALVRWQHPSKGLLAPGQFIPIAEETGMIAQLSIQVLEIACRDAVAWIGEFDRPDFSVAVNLSGRQVSDQRVVEEVTRVLGETGLAPGCLELEITETEVMAEPERAVVTLRALSELGVKLSIDDFGTGYSSMSYLKRIPASYLKIDRSFVRDTPDDPEDVAICRAIIALAHSLDIELVAEGVETEAQRRMLSEAGCEAAQGYLFARPMPAADFATFLREHLRQADAPVPG